MVAWRSEDVTVVHVDDSEALVDVTATHLEQTEPSLDVLTATDVDTALSLVEEHDPCCVVSDYDMPGTNGLEFLELLRTDYPDLPFILFTGKGNEEIASQAISAGVDEYIQKDIGTDQYVVLANRISNLVKSYRAQQAAEQTEQRYHNLIDTAPVPIVLFDQDKELVYANDAAVDFLGAEDRGELAGRQMPEFVHPEDTDLAVERFGQVMEGTAAGEQRLRIQTLDGTIKERVIATAPGIYRNEPVAQAVLRSHSPE